MDEDFFEFEAAPEAAPQLILGKKKKKKKKKEEDTTHDVDPCVDPAEAPKEKKKKKKAEDISENGGHEATSAFSTLLRGDDGRQDEDENQTPTSAFAALGVDNHKQEGDVDGDAGNNQLAASALPKKKKKKRKESVLNPLDTGDVAQGSAVQDPDQSNGGTSNINFEEMPNDTEDAPVASPEKKNRKNKGLSNLGRVNSDLPKVIEPASDVGSEQQLEQNLELEPDLVTEVKRSITATEKKKAKKERERLAKLEKTKKEQDEIDALMAELGDGKPPEDEASAADTQNSTDAPNVASMTAAQKKRSKKKKKAAADKDDDPEIDALMAELGVSDPAQNVEASEASASVGHVDELLAEFGGEAPSAATKKKVKKKKKKTAEKDGDEDEEPAEARSTPVTEVKKPKKKESAAVRKMREHREKLLAEEERLRKIREAEEARIAEEERKRQEEIQKKELEKEKKKQKEREKKERKRKEGTLLSKAEKERRRKAELFRQQLAAQGIVPAATLSEKDIQSERPEHAGFEKKIRPSQNTSEESQVVEPVKVDHDKEAPTPIKVEVSVPAEVEPSAPEPEIIPDAWEDLPEPENDDKENGREVDGDTGEDEEEENGDSDEDEEDSDSQDSEYEGMSKAEIVAEKRLDALRSERHKVREQARASRTIDRLRSPVICILGHVDTGKTKILDRIRKTNVQDGEAGGITQQIGATYFPIEAVKKEATKLQEGKELEYNVPSLLIIDTPGHESFTNLRSRGSSLCDIAILVIDIMHGLEPQTRESIDLLKLRKTPFIIALNKIDRIYDWDARPHNCPARESLAKQQRHAREEFERRVRETKLELAEIGFNTELYWENSDARKYVSIVPTSAITGEGIPDLLMLLLALPQRLLIERLMFNPVLEATVLEVKVIEGLGTTIDIILTGGTIHEGDTIMVVGLDGPIVTTIRALLTPHPMKEMRVKGQYLHHKKIEAAQGVKISADDLEKAVAGTQLMVVEDPTNEVEMTYVREEVMKDYQTILTSVDRSGLGVYVQASTLGSLEALLEFLRTSKIPVSGINIGPVHKRDVTKASTMLEKRKEYATILAFDVGVEKEARELAEEVGVQIFTADIIYHLFDMFTAYMEEMKKKRREDVNDDVVFPSICKILPQHIYNKKDPIIVGVDVMEGILRVGTPLVVKHGDGWLDIGQVASIELNKKQVVTAKKGESVAVKIQHKNTDHIMYGRHFDFQDALISKMSRSAIDLLKENFRDDLGKEDWILVIKLKKMFEIF